MSEKLPASNPRLANFEANKAARDKNEWEQNLYGDAGVHDFSDDAKKRIEEADAYERHMAALADRDTEATSFDDLENQPSAGYEAEVEAAYAENETFDEQQAQAERDQKEHDLVLSQALEDKFAADPKLRFMNGIAAEIADLRNKEVAGETADDDVRRMGELEDRLQELLVAYAERPDYDPAIADMLMDETDTAALDQAAENALREQSEQAEQAAEAEAEPTAPEVEHDTKDEDDATEQADDKPSFDVDEATAAARARLSKKADELEAAALEKLDANHDADEQAGEADDEEAPEGDTDDDKAERPVIKQQVANEAPTEVASGAALEGESLEEYEARHNGGESTSEGLAALDEIAEEQAAARDALEYQERGGEDDADDAEKDSSKGRVSKFRSWLSGVRRKGSLLSAKAYGGMMEGFGKLGTPFTARKEGELDEAYEHRQKRNGVIVAAVGATVLALAARYGFNSIGSSGGGGAGSGGEAITVPDSSETFPTPEQVVPTTSPEVSDWSDAARTADAGEGWYQTFQEMNIPQNEWGDLLQKVGPELEQDGYAYRMDDGSYGINRAGELPTEVLDLIERNR